MRDILDTMNLDCGIPLLTLQVDGGMTENNLLMQWQSDLIGIDVIRPQMAETTSLGVAMLAGNAIGEWDMDQEVQTKKTVFKPQIDGEERQSRHRRWKMAVDRSLGWSPRKPTISASSSS